MKKIILMMLVMIGAGKAMAQNFKEVAGCKESDYIEADIEASVGFKGMGYSPRCLKVLKGSEINIAASQIHPLVAIPGDSASAVNPIPAAVNTVSVVFSETGVFGYFCDRHGDASGQGMAGSIWVVDSF